jgi:opacity protein-like surface antigen
MKRFGQLVLAIGVAAAALTGSASAQTSEPRIYAGQFTIGPTFGNKSDLSIGGEFDYKLGTEWEAFAEIGHMFNVATSNMDDRAQSIANFIGGSPSVGESATYYDVGVKYLFVPLGSGYQPYAGVGLGAAHVTKETVFSVGGTELTEQQLLELYGVQLGSDLAGSSTKFMMVIALGVSRNFMEKYFLDVSYRYGPIFAKSGTIEDDKTIHSQRLQLGLGVRF